MAADDVMRARKSAIIPATDLNSALTRFAKSTGLQIVYLSAVAEGLKTRGSPAGLSPPDTLAKLLAGTGLQFSFVDGRTVTIYRTDRSSADLTRGRPPVQMASADGILPQIAQAAPAPAPAPVAPAEADRRIGLEELVVTARRVEENLMQVPISISAITSDAIEDRGVTNIIELSQFTPGLYAYIGNDGNGHMDREQRRLSFRGLSTASTSAAIFIDGAAYGGNGEPFVGDVERVEVLKGPQSVYFGRSTFSGAVNYVTKDPSDHFTGRVSAELYSYDGHELNLSMSGPIVADRLGVRAAVRRYHFGGYYKNGVTGSQLGEQSTTSANLSVVATPTDKLKIHAYYSYTFDNDGAPVQAAIKTAGTGPIETCNLGGTGGAYWCGALPNVNTLDPRNISTQTTIDDFLRRELFSGARNYPLLFDPNWVKFGVKRITHNAHVRFDYEMESGWALSSILAYDYTKYAWIVDQQQRDVGYLANPLYPATPAALAAACAANQLTCYSPPQVRYSSLNQGIQKDYSVEARVTSPQEARLRGTVGANLYSFLAPPLVNYGNGQAGRNTNASTKSTVFTPAVFAGLYFDITDQFTLNAEARYQWDRIGQQQYFPTFSPRLKDTFKSFSPRVTLDYKISQDSMAFATFSRGYRPGGFNTGLQGLTAADLQILSTLGTNLTFEQEKLDNFEVGHKGTWLDNRLRTTVAAYYMRWRNGAVTNQQIFTPSAGGIRAIAVTANVGAVDLKGIELDATALITEKLTIDATLDYETARYKTYVYSPNGLKIRNSTDVTGNQLEQVPQWTWTVSPQYKSHLSGDWEWFARLDYRHRGRIYVDAANVAWMQPRDLFDIRAGVSQSAFNIEFYVKNLFDDKRIPEAVRGNDLIYGPTLACPPCYSAASPPNLAGGAVLNEVRMGLPSKRTFGIKGTYNF